MVDDSVKLARLTAALAASGDVVYDWDLGSDGMEWFGPVAEVFSIGDMADLSTGDRFHALVNSEDLQHRLRVLTRHLLTGDRFDCEYRVRAVDGSFRWIHERALAEIGPSGRPVRMSGTLRATTGRRRSEERLEYLANFDGLTGHFNRSRLRQAVEHGLACARRFRRPAGYIAVDIDNLAMINDAFGFEVGNAVIVGLGERIERLVSAGDVIGRLEGGGYGVLLSSCDAAEIAAVAERIIRAAREAPIRTTAGPVAITVSVGGLLFPASAKSSQDVMTRAETALGQAKRGGRNHFVLYQLSEQQRRTVRQDMTIAREVQRALAEDRLLFAYQPVVEGSTRAPAFYECLLRMQRRDGSVMNAGHFIPVVEQLGLIRQIDRHVLELAVRELTLDPAVVLAVNISGLTATDHGWLRGLVGMLKDKPDLATRLVIEITETAALQDLEESQRFVSAVRDLGCRVALDDFGAGYTSFRHLKALSVDLVKIDGSFIGNLTNGPENQLFIRTLLGLASGFGLTTVAECVETAEEADFLAREGVTYLQGHHFGRPLLTRAAVPSAGLGPAAIAPLNGAVPLPGRSIGAVA